MEPVELVLESVGNDYPGLVREALAGLSVSNIYIINTIFFIIYC